MQPFAGKKNSAKFSFFLDHFCGLILLIEVQGQHARNCQAEMSDHEKKKHKKRRDFHRRACARLVRGAAFAQTELISNGSFESGAQTTMNNLPGWDWVGPADNNSDYGVAQSSVYPDVAEAGNFLCLLSRASHRRFARLPWPIR